MYCLTTDPLEFDEGIVDDAHVKRVLAVCQRDLADDILDTCVAIDLMDVGASKFVDGPAPRNYHDILQVWGTDSHIVCLHQPSENLTTSNQSQSSATQLQLATMQCRVASGPKTTCQEMISLGRLLLIG